MALVRHGAAITLNGIAQGYATDRVVDMLRTGGLSTTLVNMGEIRAIGARADGHAVARRPCRSGQARRAHGNCRPRRSRGRDHGGRGVPLRSGGPVHASIRSRDGTQSRALSDGQRHRADRHRGGCAFDRFQPDACVADRRHRGRAAGRAGPAGHRSDGDFARLWSLRRAGSSDVGNRSVK